MDSSATWPCPALPSASLAGRTTLKVGGAVEWLVEPGDPDALREVWLAALEAGYRFDAADPNAGTLRVLGGGANLIVADGELPCLVIGTSAMRRTFRPLDPGEALTEEEAAASSVGIHEPAAPTIASDDPRLIVWAGASMPGLVRTCTELGWRGLEGLIGVPGNLGGGLAMNAGGKWGELWDVVDLVRVLTPDGELVDVEREEASPGYRDGGISRIGGAVVVGAVLRLELSTKAEVEARAREFLFEKRAVQPVTEASAGCIFKNPSATWQGETWSAGRLIDHLGLKGKRRGKAVVSEKHGNFLVNEGGAAATDVLALIEDLHREVADRTGIELEVEVKRWSRPPGWA